MEENKFEIEINPIGGCGVAKAIVRTDKNYQIKRIFYDKSSTEKRFNSNIWETFSNFINKNGLFMTYTSSETFFRQVNFKYSYICLDLNTKYFKIEVI
jgi:hypothetical protein